MPFFFVSIFPLINRCLCFYSTRLTNIFEFFITLNFHFCETLETLFSELIIPGKYGHGETIDNAGRSIITFTVYATHSRSLGEHARDTYTDILDHYRSSN